MKIVMMLRRAESRLLDRRGQAFLKIVGQKAAKFLS
jgi:hypothetical protein